MKTRQNPIRSFVIAFALLAASALPASAGVNRWTTSGPAAAVSSVVIDPTDPAVVYAGTLGRGILKSSNGGLSWSAPSSGTLNGFSIYSLAIDPLTPSSVYAGTSAGVFKSTDGSASWSGRLLAASIYSLVFPPQKPSTIFGADFDTSYYPKPSLLYKSTDEGRTWSSPRDSGFTILPGTAAIDPMNPSVLYAANWYGGVYKSVDAGSTWRLTSGDLAGVYVSALAIAQRDPATLYAGAYNYAGAYSGFIKSVDAGSTWRLLSTDLKEFGVTTLKIDPQNPSTLYAGTSRGVFRSTDGGASWRDFNAMLTNFEVVALAIDRTGTRLHAASRSGGVFDYQISSGALDLSVGSDSKARLLFADPDGRLVIRIIDRSGGSSTGAPYGPYPGWQSRAVADGSDGLTRVLWTNEDGSAALWLLGPEGNRASYRLGPVAGSTAVDVTASHPGATHVLWKDGDGRIALWSVDNGGSVSTGPAYGPYPGWNAVAIADGQDGLTRVLWNRADGSAALASFGAAALVASHSFGPVAGWRAVDIAVGADAQTRILWTHQDGRMALWRVDGDGNPTALGSIYPPPAGFEASRIAAGTDGLTRVLWSDASGSAILWTMSADNVFQGSFSPGPDPAVGVAGAWTGTWSHSSNAACDPSISVPGIPAQATFEQKGSIVSGTLSTASVPCGWGAITYLGSLEGNALEGNVRDDEGLEFPAHGIFSGSSLEITIDNGGDYIIGRLNLHR